jgi:hypothetical protein
MVARQLDSPVMKMMMTLAYRLDCKTKYQETSTTHGVIN